MVNTDSESYKLYFGIHTFIRNNMTYAIFVYQDFERNDAIEEIQQTYVEELIQDYQRYYLQNGHAIDAGIFSDPV